MDPIVHYLTKSELPENREEARRVKNTSVRYTLIKEKLYCRGHSAPYQRCVGQAKAEYLMKEIHIGVCGNHFGGITLSFKQLLWFPDHGVRFHDRAPTGIGRARIGSKTSAFADNFCGSRTTELGLTTGHRPELDVPEHDPRQTKQPRPDHGWSWVNFRKTTGFSPADPGRRSRGLEWLASSRRAARGGQAAQGRRPTRERRAAMGHRGPPRSRAKEQHPTPHPPQGPPRR
ncbi:hypothetical protein TIFTF001_030988 [Ficus carica]|uniref:Uncharacterized protein n=1 Tax=Ficus carica TaxID=3494 RepID=A0AA88J3M4_FICCA|nr:hypothetical protein TIFTF001_030988 [Ficus carica]